MSKQKMFDIDLDFGEVGEELVETLISKEGQERLRVEVKRDTLVACRSGVTLECLSRGRPSGITRSEDDWWAFVLAGPYYHGEVIVMIETARLRRLIHSAAAQDFKRKQEGRDGIASNLVVPFSMLVAPEYSRPPLTAEQLLAETRNYQ
ncbi:MAG: hypothetical protein ACYC63_20640 [Armatimonadota bacterium]